MKCFNCQCLQTPLWRRGPGGEQLCNACGIYYKNHGTHRSMPVKMKSTAGGGKNKTQARTQNRHSNGRAAVDKKKRKQKVKAVDAYEAKHGKNSEVFAAHVLIKLSYDVYMMTTPQYRDDYGDHPAGATGALQHHHVPTHHAHTHTHAMRVPPVVAAGGVTSPYEAGSPITATS